MVCHDLQVLLVKLEQILHLNVDSSDFGPVRDGQLTLFQTLSDDKQIQIVVYNTVKQVPRILTCFFRQMVPHTS